MGGFVPDCHTQTFVEVAKLENSMLVKAINRQTHPYFAWPTGTGWRVLDCEAEGRTFISEEYDDKEDALAHIKILNEQYWLKKEAEYLTRAVIWKAIEQSAPAPSSSGITSLWILLKGFLQAIIIVKKVLGITRNHNIKPPSQPVNNATKYFEWKRITLEDIDRLWRKSGKLDAPFREQLGHFAHGVESTLKNEVPDQFRLNWQSITQDDIDRQWVVSFSVHPAFGQQLGHFAVGIQTIAINRNQSIIEIK
ncbi:MAG: hypothetical protein ACKVOY_10645 [Burkholderiaceae bacterium]